MTQLQPIERLHVVWLMPVHVVRVNKSLSRVNIMVYSSGHVEATQDNRSAASSVSISCQLITMITAVMLIFLATRLFSSDPRVMRVG